MRVYVFGNGNLGFDAFVQRYVPSLVSALDADATFVVCDFRGTDVLTMEWLKTRSGHVEVLHVGSRPRYLPDRFRTRVSSWTIRGGFASDADRDDAALQRCTHVLAVDFNSDDARTSATATMLARATQAGRSVLPAPAD